MFKNGIVDAKEFFYLAKLKGWSWLRHKMPRVISNLSYWHLSSIQCLESLSLSRSYTCC